MATSNEYKTEDTDDEEDGEYDKSSDTFININETDFYKLLNVNSNATKEEIRKAYFRRAREFHPDKNKNTSTTKLFQSMKSAYETLYDDKRRAEYDTDADFDQTDDNEDDDEIFSASKNTQMRLIMGEKISDSYRARIDRYVAEYETLSFRNNFNEKFIEIITKMDNDNNTKIDAIDTYGSCNVCRQSYLNRHLHERENCEPYENLFSNTMKPITLEETIDIDLWNWKAVEKTSVYFPIWNAQKEWGESLSLIEQLKDPVEIICKPERYWTLFIDKYQQNQLELMKLPKVLSQIAIIDYLPVMDENNDQRTTTGHYYLFDYTTTTNHGKSYIKALLCHKMAEYINRNNDLDWLINAIENFSPVGYELLNAIKSPYDWKQLGDRVGFSNTPPYTFISKLGENAAGTQKHCFLSLSNRLSSSSSSPS
ncbi:unnamed protein product [Rotaria sordida]|uniref:J domain-containing protein n=1 Tax=Rotaria sordida TaxID=392033 RepID=A0A819T8H7_9BILA|nr:unnamed protein product [Rotaria sordida]